MKYKELKKLVDTLAFDFLTKEELLDREERLKDWLAENRNLPDEIYLYFEDVLYEMQFYLRDKYGVNGLEVDEREEKENSLKTYIVATNGSITFLCQARSENDAIFKCSSKAQEELGYNLSGFEAYEVNDYFEDEEEVDKVIMLEAVDTDEIKKEYKVDGDTDW